MPSRASAEAVYEPPGPPPTTSVVHLVGIESMFILVVFFFSFLSLKGDLLAPVGWEKECPIAQEVGWRMTAFVSNLERSFFFPAISSVERETGLPIN